MPAAPRRSTARAPACPWRSSSRATAEAAIAEALLAGAHVFTVDGTIATAGKLIAGIAPRIGWFDLATLKEPYRLEGKKTMGLELAEQLGWETPDMLIYPTGGGTGLVGIWKAYDELAALGWIKARQPRFVAVQAEGCAPVVKAWTDGADARRCGRTRSPMRRACACRGPSPAGRCSRSSATPAATAEPSASARSSTPSGSSRASRASGPRPRAPPTSPR